MKYYCLKKNWPKVKRHIDDPEVQAILVRDFNKYTWGSWREKFLPGMVPHQMESCDWWCEHCGPLPAFWQYTKHAACHWLVNFTLKLAERVEPKRTWRILTSDFHSTVWDGEGLLFDFNFQAMGISAKECFESATNVAGDARQLKEGELLQVHLAEHYSREGGGWRQCMGCERFFEIKAGSKAKTCSPKCARQWGHRGSQSMVAV